MPDEATSLHLRNTHELLLLIPLKQGFVEGTDRRTSYASRLRVLLATLYRPSRGVLEKSLMPTASFTDKLGNIYHFHYGVVERLQQSQLILSATFDSTFESYFHNLVDNVGAFLDAVFCHCQGYTGRTCQDGYEAFADFIREHQIQAGVLYAATPDLTVDDFRVLRGAARGRSLLEPLEDLQTATEAENARWRARHASPEWQGEDEFRRIRAQSVRQLVRLVWEARDLFPEEERVDASRNARQVFDEAAGLLARSFILDESLDERVFFEGAAPLDPADVAGQKEALAWIDRIRAIAARDDRVARNVASDSVAMASLVQDDIAVSCDSDQAVLALLRFPAGEASKLLNALADRVDRPDPTYRLNVALTFAGLRRAGLDDATLERFPKEFREGMEQRVGMLGDLGWPSHPDYWHVVANDGRRLALPSVDLVVVLHWNERAGAAQGALDMLHELCGTTSSDVLVYTESLYHAEIDHFGYPRTEQGPNNQPEIVLGAAAPAALKGFDNRIAAGDLFLGYQDGRGRVARSTDEARGNPVNPELFRGGTFLVVRKLAQNRPAFDRSLARQEESRELASQHALGLRNGERLAGCPMGHVQRAKPEAANVPRIRRRSFSYGPRYDADDTTQAERGHVFMAFNASIAEQYEVLQRWINAGNRTGLLSGLSDAFAGQTTALALRDQGSGPFAVPHVTLRWGMYTFVPSKLALRYLAQIAPSSREPSEQTRALRQKLREAELERLERRGRGLLAMLDGIADPDVAKLSWKQVIEEPTSFTDGQAVWAAIRKEGGRKQTPYGLLVADAPGVEEVLGDDGSRFSVREYRVRLSSTAGDFHLGYDAPVSKPRAEQTPPATRHAEAPCAADAGEPASLQQVAVGKGGRRYDAFAYHANQAVQARVETAHTSSHDGLDVAAIAKREASAFLRGRASFDLRDLARQVVGKVAVQLIGVPEDVRGDDLKLREFLDHFINITRYQSFPYPESWLARKARHSGEALVWAYGENVESWGGFGARLRAYSSDPVTIRNAVVGANIGFVPPAVSMLTNLLTRWLDNGDIEQATAYAADASPEARERLTRAVIKDLRYDTTFASIYRTAVEGNGLATPGTYVVCGAQSAYRDVEDGDARAVRWLFGGAEGETQHGCPMRYAALSVLTGAVLGVAQQLRHELAQSSQITLVRSGPTIFGFERVGRVLPGVDLVGAQTVSAHET